MPRGGARRGEPGKSYSNRSDLNAQPVRTAPGQVYGQAKQQADAQRAVPLPQTPPVQAVPGPQATPFVPPDPGLLHAPSARPGEPVTAGLPIGAGPGPEAMGALGGPNDQILASLYQAYQQHPSNGLLGIIQQVEQSRAPAQ